MFLYNSLYWKSNIGVYILDISYDRLVLMLLVYVLGKIKMSLYLPHLTLDLIIVEGSLTWSWYNFGKTLTKFICPSWF